MKLYCKVETRKMSILEASNKTSDDEMSKDTSTKILNVQSVDETLKVDTLSTENLCDGKSDRKKKRRRKCKKVAVKDEGQSWDKNDMDAQFMNNTAEGNVIIKNLKIKDEVESVGDTKMNTGLVKSLAEGNTTFKNKKVHDGVQIFCQTEVDTESSEDIAEGNVNVENTCFLDKVQNTFHGMMDAGLTVDNSEEVRSKVDTITLAGGNATTKKPMVKDVAQDTGLTKVDGGSTENLAQRNVDIEYPKIQDGSQSMFRNNMDSGSALSSTLGTVAGKRKKKRRKKHKHVEDIQEETDASLVENLDEGNVLVEKPKVKDELQSLSQIQMNSESTINLANGNAVSENTKIQDEVQRMDQKKMVTLLPAENHAQGNVSGKRRKKRKKKKAKVNNEVHSEMDMRSTENIFDRNVVIVNLENQDEFQSMDQNKIDTRQPAKNHSQGNAQGKKRKKKDKAKCVSQVQMDSGSTENVAEGIVTIQNPKSQDVVQNQSIYQEKMETWLTHNIAKGNVILKRKKKQKRKQRQIKKVETPNEVPGRMDVGSTENPAGVTECIRRTPETRDEVQSMDLKIMDAVLTENLSEGRVTLENPKNKEGDDGLNKVKMDTGQDKDFTKVHLNGKKRRNRSTKNTKNVRENMSKAANMLRFSVNGPSQVSNDISLNDAIGHAERRSANSLCNAFTLKDADALHLTTTLITSIRRKLLVLDINGLLADIVHPAPKHCTADIKICGRAVFRRPFCDDFLNFCFQNFDVGIWSSRSKKIVDKVVDYLLEDQKGKLQFCWDMTHSTQTGFKTLENRHKPLVCKELRKIWESGDPNYPWKKGDYDESNTLLLDDSPYKALLNPLHTAIFPSPYQYSYENDNSLGPGGDLRVYLEGLVTCENVQIYVEQHPFGQIPITEQNLSWEFYKQVLEQMSNPVTHKNLIPQ